MFLLWGIILVAALALLVVCANRFTHSAVHIARLLRLPEFVVGVTVVSIGTSLPELVTSLAGVFSDNASGAEVVVGTVIGSNIANILLIGGLAAVMVKKIDFQKRMIELETVLLTISAGFLVLTAMDGVVTRVEGIAMVATFIILLVFTLREYKNKAIPEEHPHSLSSLNSIASFANMLFFGAGLSLAAWLVVKAALILGDMTGLATASLAATTIAVGTSLPELIITVQAALKKHAGIALGNIIGSNVFNILAIIGIPAIIENLPVSTDMIFLGLPFFGAASILYIFTGLSKRLTVYEGSIFLILYAIFLGKIFHWF